MTAQSELDTQSDLLKRKFEQLRAAVNLGLSAVFIALLIVVAAGLWLRHDDTQRAAQHNAENLTRVLSEHLAIRIDAIEETLLELASHSRFIGGPNASGQEWMPILNVVSAGRYGVEALMVTDAGGRVTYSSLPIFMGESYADGNSFRALSEDPSNDALIADEPVRSSNDRKIVVPLGRVLRTPQSEFEGMTIATFAPDQLRDFYATVDVGENGVVWLLKSPAHVLLRVPRSATPNDEPWPTIPVSATNGERMGFAIGPLESGGPDYLTAYRTLEGTELTVAVSQAQSDVLAPWWNDVYAAIALTIMAGLIMLVGAVIFSRTTRAGETTLADAVGGKPDT